MNNLPSSTVATPGRLTPPFGPVDPLVLALRLEAALIVLGEARILTDAGKPAAAKTLIREAQARISENSRALRQEHDRAEQAAAVPAPSRRVTARPTTVHVEGLAADFDRVRALLAGGDNEAAKGALVLATQQLRNLGAALGQVTR